MDRVSGGNSDKIIASNAFWDTIRAKIVKRKFPTRRKRTTLSIFWRVENTKDASLAGLVAKIPRLNIFFLFRIDSVLSNRFVFGED